MKFWNVRGIAAILFLICSTSAFAQSATTQSNTSAKAAQPAATAPADSQATVTIADAQKAYVAGKWKDAARLFEQACPNEPDSVRTECYLWNVLALSQIGAAKEFSTAGKRLDSLIQTTNPQRAIYADLMMTSAQFRLYLGKYDKAAEDLIQAIETSHPHQAIVLQKVCKAVKAKVKSEDLNDRCNLLNNPDSLKAIRTASQAKATAATEPAKVAAPEPKPVVAEPAPAVEQPKTAAPVAAPAAPAATAPIEYWTLQLGAFGTKSNADLLVSNLKKQKISCTIIEQPRGEKTLYLVQTGKFDTKDQAIDFAANKLAPLKIEYQPLLKR